MRTEIFKHKYYDMIVKVAVNGGAKVRYDAAENEVPFGTFTDADGNKYDVLGIERVYSGFALIGEKLTDGEDLEWQ